MYNKSAFTLIELSIVLVIIGLIIGGVLVGRDLIRQAELRAVAKEVESFKAAVNTFKLKYNALPGDMTNAESIWGSDSSCPNTAANTVPKLATCNGNGDGWLAINGNINTYYEGFRFWQQLADASLVQGQFTGVAGASAVGHVIIGTNTPASRFSGTGYSLIYTMMNALGNSVSGAYFDTPYGHYMIWGMPSPAALYSTNYPVLNGKESLSFDSKYDDGLPGKGTIRTYSSTFSSTYSLPTCVSGTAAATSTYVVGDTPACSFHFMMGF